MKFLLPVIAHLLGDFIFQTTAMARNKGTVLKHLITHGLIYIGFIILSLLWFRPIQNIIYISLFIGISHTIIDYSRNKLLDKRSKEKVNDKTFNFMLFLVDQFIHLLIIIISVHYIKGPSIMGKSILNVILVHISWNQLYNTTVIALLYILCLTPAAVFINEFFTLFSVQTKVEINEKVDKVKSGYLIGMLERIIILTLGLYGELGAIGLVLAAKSIARFNQLNDQDFAEKYLVGTLLSTLIAIICIVIGDLILLR